MRSPPPDPGDAPLIALAEALVRAHAAEAELAYELLELLAGRRSLRVGPDRRIDVSP